MKLCKFSALLAAALLMTALAGCSASKTAASSEVAGTAVETQTVETGDIATENTVTGSIMADRNVPVMSKVACKVKEVNVKAGDTVKSGDVLFTLDTSDLQDTYGDALNTYNSTKTLLDEQIRQTQESLDNMKALYEMGAVSKNSVEQTQLALMQAQNTRNSTLTQMGLDDVVEAIADPTIKSTIDGTVSSVSVTSGVMVSPTSVAAVVSEIGHPQAVVNVSETIQPKIKVGDSVDVEIPSLNDTIVTGTIASVASAVSQTNALYEVNIDLPEDLSVSLGMFAKATFHTDASPNTVLIPTQSIQTEDGGQQYVFIVDDNIAYRIDITTGLIGETQTEVTSGLHGGEQLVTRGQSYLSDGAPVTVTEG